MSRLKLAVVGVGHLGRIHAQLAAALSEIELVAVVDSSTSARQEVAQLTGAAPLANHLDVLGLADAAVVATPTKTHAEVASDLLRGGLHVLVEKPIAPTSGEADLLVDLARRMQLILQVGHVERFNPGFVSVEQQIVDPKYIEAKRHSGFTFRSTDVGVVMDLMIHDIDIALSLVQSTVVEARAIGLSVMGGHEDMVSARLQFANGAVANLSSSRTSFEPARVMSVYSDRGFASIDFAMRQSALVAPREDLMSRRFSVDELTDDEKQHFRENLFQELLVMRPLPKVETNAIEEELKEFAAAATGGAMPRVTGADGRDAVEVAEMVLNSLAVHQWDGRPTGRVGPLATPAAARRRSADDWSSDDTTILPRKAG